MRLRRPMMTAALTVALIAPMASRTARGDDIAPPPAPMQGGESLTFVDSLADQPGGADGEHVTVGKNQGLIIRGRDGAETTTQVIELKTPAITADRYVIKGWVKYAGVAGDGYLESLNRFNGNDAFSRTAGDRGPMGKLTGDSNWRVFILPMNADAGMRPEHISVNVVMPGKGEVILTDVHLVQFGPTTAPATAPSANVLLPTSAAQTPMRTSILRYVFVSVAVAGVLAVAEAIRRRRRRHETITSELRRMHALDAI